MCAFFSVNADSEIRVKQADILIVTHYKSRGFDARSMLRNYRNSYEL